MTGWLSDRASGGAKAVKLSVSPHRSRRREPTLKRQDEEPGGVRSTSFGVLILRHRSYYFWWNLWDENERGQRSRPRTALSSMWLWLRIISFKGDRGGAGIFWHCKCRHTQYATIRIIRWNHFHRDETFPSLPNEIKLQLQVALGPIGQINHLITIKWIWFDFDETANATLTSWDQCGRVCNRKQSEPLLLSWLKHIWPGQQHKRLVHEQMRVFLIRWWHSLERCRMVHRQNRPSKISACPFLLGAGLSFQKRSMLW